MISAEEIKEALTKKDPIDGVFLLLARVWGDGYSAGVADGCDDVLVADQTPNPYPGGGGLKTV